MDFSLRLPALITRPRPAPTSFLENEISGSSSSSVWPGSWPGQSDCSSSASPSGLPHPSLKSSHSLELRLELLSSSSPTSILSSFRLTVLDLVPIPPRMSPLSTLFSRVLLFLLPGVQEEEAEESLVLVLPSRPDLLLTFFLLVAVAPLTSLTSRPGAIAILLNFLLRLLCTLKSCQGWTFSVKLSDSMPIVSPRPRLVLILPVLARPGWTGASRSLSLNWRLLVPLSLDKRPTLSTLELLSSLMLLQLPRVRLLVLLHRLFQA